MKLTDAIHLLKIDFEVPITAEQKLKRFVNVLIIFGKKITLIDTGVKGSERQIENYLQQQGRDISEIQTIILSHSHPDHVGAAARLKKMTGCRILTHKNEKDWIENIELQHQERPVPGFLSLLNEPVKIDCFLNHNDEFIADKNITLKILHAPGHSKGSLNILFLEDKLLFTADSVPLAHDIPNYDNYTELRETLSLIKNNKNYNVLLSSWYEPVSGEASILSLIQDGEAYMDSIDRAVKYIYQKKNAEPLACCRQVIVRLGLPLVFVNPLVDRAFRSHFLSEGDVVA